jgi:hypothetical protein
MKTARKIKKEDKLDTQLKKSLNLLIDSGKVFASCPHCNIYLDHPERTACYCTACNKVFNDQDVIYYSNTITSINN